MHDRMMALYFSALEIPEGERSAFLANEAAGDAKLIDEVEALLRVDGEGDKRLLESPTPSGLFEDASGARAPLESVDHYNVLHEIGRGGMGIVYLAEDTKLDRQVALKGLPQHLTQDKDRLTRFQREAKMVAHLNHPHIAAIYGVAEQDGEQYLVLEYIPGETLKDLLARTPIEAEQALGIANQLADAIEYAHDRGVVHCDLKPANVMISERGEIKVLDFGLARALREPTARGGTLSAWSPHSSDGSSFERGTIMGTPGYLSPEQVRGRAASQATDIFSFGVVLYQMLSGVAPFSADTLAESFAATLKTEPDLGLLPPAVPASVRTLLELALAKQPKKRIRHMGDCRLLLQHALEETGRERAQEIRVIDAEPSLMRFRLTEGICRKLDRERLDPRLIGYELQYLDNRKASDALVFFLHAVGRDHEQWREHLRSIPYRGVAPTQVGFEPDVDVRLRLSLRDHLIVLREFMRSMTAEIRPNITIATAHSAGADLVMRMVAEIEEDEGLPLDGLLPLEPNLGLATCQVTGQMAAFDRGRESELLTRLRDLSAVPESLDDWIILYDYLSEIISKFRDDIDTLRDFGAEIIAPFQADGPTPFLAWYRAVTRKIAHVRCVFSETPVYHQRILALRLEHFDKDCFGEHHREESIHIEHGTTHLDLYHVERVSLYLQELVRQISSAKR